MKDVAPGSLPREQVEKKYHFQVTDGFLHHLQLASVRFNNGGSGSFVSPHGLLFTNHHVGADCIQKLSSAEHDYMADGFHAITQADEKACPDLEVNVLLSTEDVTARVNDGVKTDAAPAEANRLRRATMARIEEECTRSSGNRCDVVTLYSGGQYGLYRYKKYTDIRLVFAPEYSIAAFGGDPITSPIRAIASTSRCFACTKLASRSTQRSISFGARPVCAMASLPLCPAIPAPRAGSRPSLNWSSPAILHTR